MGQHKDAASFTAVTQNLRGLTTKKLEIIIKNMEDKAVDITVLQEMWKVLHERAIFPEATGVAM